MDIVFVAWTCEIFIYLPNEFLLSRHDFVAASVIQGMMQVQLETEVPVFR
jgi:hypothetical protein